MHWVIEAVLPARNTVVAVCRASLAGVVALEQRHKNEIAQFIDLLVLSHVSVGLDCKTILELVAIGVFHSRKSNIDFADVA